MIIFDIETGPLPESDMPPFDESTVKLGQLKDPIKVTAKIEEARAKYVERAALSPLTGQVLAIGYLPPGEAESIVVENENVLLADFWWRFLSHRRHGNIIVGHNILGFDLPFLVRRSWLLGIDVPADAFDGRYFNRIFVDTMDRWGCGTRGGDFVKLDVLAKAFGVGGKPDGITGGMFAELLANDRKAAEEYLHNDLEMTAKVAERMGLV